MALSEDQKKGFLVGFIALVVEILIVYAFDGQGLVKGADTLVTGLASLFIQLSLIFILEIWSWKVVNLVTTLVVLTLVAIGLLAKEAQQQTVEIEK